MIAMTVGELKEFLTHHFIAINAPVKIQIRSGYVLYEAVEVNFMLEAGRDTTNQLKLQARLAPGLEIVIKKDPS
jgi:hypothetical protein